MHRLGIRVKKNERGVALLVVLTTIALLASVVADFQFNSRVDLQLAYNSRDALQAEQNALSALRVRALILRQSRKLQGALSGVFSSLGMDAGAAPGIGQILEMLPVDCGILSMLAKVGEDDGFDFGAEDDVEGTETQDFMAGECTAISESEHAKISINMLRNKLNKKDAQVTRLLLGFLSNPSFERHYQEDDLNGSRVEEPQELVGAIMDWIDRDNNSAVSELSDEGRSYDLLADNYRIKNAPFDSVSELQLVHGVDDEFFQLLRDHVTIHNDGTAIELATASLERIWLGLLATVPENVPIEEIFVQPGFIPLQEALMELKGAGAMMGITVNVNSLKALVGQVGLTGFFDTGAFNEVFTDKTSTTWYKIKAEGIVGNAVKRIESIFQANEGKFYYYRMN
ncbi:MAG: type II secretion system protein GspK [Myxococcota bacterium]|jgi:hypothetical protein|nr:type II secretion system protein GspK [Myxococcota bacterium]